jgi:hypothetical protein
MKYILVLAIFFCATSYAQTQNCTEYCSLFLSHCNSVTTGKTWYDSMTTCMQVCASFPLGSPLDTGSNSLGCRIYHAGTPAVTNATYHCPHASATGGGVCGSYCQAYCNMSLTYCTAASGTPGMGSAALETYPDCASICSLYTTGSIGNDVSQNTLACRIYHVQAAIESGDLSYHCPHSSPNGNGVCGTQCGAYCTQIIGACSAAPLSTPQYTSESACMAYCTNDMQTNFLGNWNDTAGDTVGCRVYHADNAQVTGLTAHCLHAGPSGDNVCGPWCTVYCDLVQQNCLGANSQYASTSACMTACNGFSTSGNAGDTTGNTVQCRVYHAGVAGDPVATNAATHCPHAGPTGGNQCIASASTTGSTTGSSSASTVVVSALLVIAMIALIL